MNIDAWFKNIEVPVIICRRDDVLKVIYENQCAIRLLNPQQQTEPEDKEIGLRDLLQIEESKWLEFCRQINEGRELSSFFVQLFLYSGDKCYADLAVSRLSYDEQDCLQICITRIKTADEAAPFSQVLETAFHLIYKASTTEEAIQELLRYAGEWTKSSRSYIFESVSEDLTSNTYEWCAPGIRPEINSLRSLSKADYSYDQIIARGLMVTDDIRRLTEADRVILEAQGIKALAIIPIIAAEGPLGYVGFDDCEKYRVWTQREIRFLKNLADMLSSLLRRRNTERSLNYSLQVLEAVTDSQESLIVVVDSHTNKILFTNHAFSAMFRLSQDELRGRTLMDILKTDSIDIRYRNLLPETTAAAGAGSDQQREYYVRQTGKWYLVRNSLINWIDGRKVIIETATDITYQKKYEAELEYLASRDRMTDTYNREWGQKLLAKILKESSERPNNTLVFIDLDGLKRTNDKFGHAAGDEMILKIVGYLRSYVRKSDVLCRWGGDEFLMILRATGEQAEEIIKKILKHLEQYNQAEENFLYLSFSYGIVEIDARKYQTVDELVSAADEKMYRNKQRHQDGKYRV